MVSIERERRGRTFRFQPGTSSEPRSIARRTSPRSEGAALSGRPRKRHPEAGTLVLPGVLDRTSRHRSRRRGHKKQQTDAVWTTSQRTGREGKEEAFRRGLAGEGPRLDLSGLKGQRGQRRLRSATPVPLAWFRCVTAGATGSSRQFRPAPSFFILFFGVEPVSGVALFCFSIVKFIFRSVAAAHCSR